MEFFKLLIPKALKILLNPPALRKCVIDKTARVCSKSELTNVELGRYSYIGYDCFMVGVSIGNFCSIANRCCIGAAEHPLDRVSSSPVFHAGKNIMGKNFATFPMVETLQTVIENDVWLGMGVYVKAGVTIHNGAVIGTGSVVTHDVPPYEIWAGNPARFIRKRFDDEIIKELLDSEWWNYSDEDLEACAVDFDNPEKFLINRGAK